MSIRTYNQDGFTLLELMVVIAIISILAAFSAPTFIRQITKAKLVEAQNLATQDQSLVEEYILLHGDFPTASEFKSLSPSLSEDSIIKNITVSDLKDNASGSILITLNNDTGIEEGQYIKYSRDADRNWSCESDLSTSVLPLQCHNTTEGAK